MVKPYYKQSNIDLSIQLTGGLDNIVELCNENGITDISIESTNSYSVNTDLITNSNNTGKQYVTKYYRPSCSVITGLVTGTITYNSIEFIWNTISGIIGYSWAITATNVPPVSGFTSTILNSVTVSGLSGSTIYYFWIKTVCSVFYESALVSINAATIMAPPAPPVTSDLVLSLYSDYGVSKSGSDVITWTDASGNGTVLNLLTGNKPQITNSHFGGIDGILFPVSGAGMLLDTPFTSIATSQQCTLFLVISSIHVIGLPVMAGLDTSFGSTPNPAGFFISQNASDKITHFTSDSGGTWNQGEILIPLSTDICITYGLNSALVGSNKTIIYKNNDASTYISTLAAMGSGTIGNAFSNFRVGFSAGETVGCVLLYKRLLTPTEMTNTYNYLKTYFSLP